MLTAENFKYVAKWWELVVGALSQTDSKNVFLSFVLTADHMCSWEAFWLSQSNCFMPRNDQTTVFFFLSESCSTVARMSTIHISGTTTYGEHRKKRAADTCRQRHSTCAASLAFIAPPSFDEKDPKINMIFFYTLPACHIWLHAYILESSFTFYI